jgi:hypothetical protein
VGRRCVAPVLHQHDTRPCAADLAVAIAGDRRESGRVPAALGGHAGLRARLGCHAVRAAPPSLVRAHRGVLSRPHRPDHDSRLLAAVLGPSRDRGPRADRGSRGRLGAGPSAFIRRRGSHDTPAGHRDRARGVVAAHPRAHVWLVRWSSSSERVSEIDV